MQKKKKKCCKIIKFEDLNDKEIFRGHTEIFRFF